MVVKRILSKCFSHQLSFKSLWIKLLNWRDLNHVKKNNFYIDKKDFEINESDEDMYSDSYYDGSKPQINKTKDMMGKMIMQKNKK